MSDLRTLHDAFAELDRRADAAAAGTAPIVRPRRAVRLVPVAATVVAVACLVAGAVWLVPGDSGTHTASPPATSSIGPSTTTARDPIPTSPDDLVARFKVVLGDTATFEAEQKMGIPAPRPSKQPGTAQPGTGVTATPLEGPSIGSFIAGTLTSARGAGRFGLMMQPSESEPSDWCKLSRKKDCVVSTLPDGSRLATGTARPAPGAESYFAGLKRPDGTMIVMDVSNQEDPAGAVPESPGGRIYSPQPPLTFEQLKAIVTSDKW
ncbi:hypothetical protein C8D87_102717 [Lentzea atacamensis]|uniref:Uncharacterized protein n=1 Tax=Lentzea atacamensis TaxID=531938 RepID=A0ABX9EGU5_9PSEU|nr:hypothetical protein [Lentzea atacamensis]RAS68648.1 hypothetical protein C8D87_102717 [Lentzea atacamensis]